LAKANSARDKKSWRAGSEYYKLYLKLESADAPVWVQLGHSLKESGDFDGAERAYSRAIAGEVPFRS
jgi:Flp pilus assembly protein TadD